MQDKKTLITIIVLLAIFLPCSILGTYRKITEGNEKELIDDNPNHEILFNDKVYFYLNDELLSVFDCPDCEIVSTTIDDENYHINYYQYGDLVLEPTLNSNFGIIKKDNLNNIYSIMTSNFLSSYTSVKNYNINHSEQVLIVENDEKWGLLSVNELTVELKIPIEYDFIGIPAHLNNSILNTSKMIAKKDNEWMILDKTNTRSVVSSNEIVDFNDNYYITYDTAYHIMDYNGQEYLGSLTKEYVYCVGNYVFVVNQSNLYIFENCSENVLKTVELATFDNLTFNVTDLGIEILINGNLYQTIEI